MRDDIVKAAEELADDGQLACTDAHALAKRLGVASIEVGKAVNRATSLRFYRCQLGVFGYGPKPEGKHKIITAAARVPDDIGDAIKARVRNGAISCKAVWELADEFKYPRLGMANICEALELQIRPCQLGCF